MRIVVASDGENVTEHFGHCKTYRTYDVENGKITKTGILDSPGHKPGALPIFLKENGANVVISGGMGGGAIDLFNQNNIEVVIGASGDSKKAAEDFLSGNLVSTGSACKEHQHHDECEN
jgi:predicted Fe-Mo cluster-binding NifX family protein